MKTNTEVAEYFKSQEWYNEFVENTKDYLKKCNSSVNTLDSILNGEKGIDTIAMAFSWIEYPHEDINGFTYWYEIDCDFIHWFNS